MAPPRRAPEEGSEHEERSPSPSATLFAATGRDGSNSPGRREHKPAKRRKQGDANGGAEAGNAPVLGPRKKRVRERRVTRERSRSQDGSEAAPLRGMSEQREDEPEVTREARPDRLDRRKGRRRHDELPNAEGCHGSSPEPTPRKRRVRRSTAGGSREEHDPSACEDVDGNRSDEGSLAPATARRRKKKCLDEDGIAPGRKEKGKGAAVKRGRKKIKEIKREKCRSESGSRHGRRRIRRRRRRQQSASRSISTRRGRRKSVRSRKDGKRGSKRDKRSYRRGAKRRRSTSRGKDSAQKKSKAQQAAEKPMNWAQMAWEIAKAGGPMAGMSWLQAQYAQHAPPGQSGQSGQPGQLQQQPPPGPPPPQLMPTPGMPMIAPPGMMPPMGMHPGPPMFPYMPGMPSMPSMPVPPHMMGMMGPAAPPAASGSSNSSESGSDSSNDSSSNDEDDSASEASGAVVAEATKDATVARRSGSSSSSKSGSGDEGKNGKDELQTKVEVGAPSKEEAPKPNAGKEEVHDPTKPQAALAAAGGGGQDSDSGESSKNSSST